MGGVESFFVISSFFAVKKHYKSAQIDIIEQFKLRLKRLYPPYITVLFVAVVFALLMERIPNDVITHALSLQNFQWMITGYSSPMQPITAHTWTLSIEVWSGLILLILLRFVSEKHFKISMYFLLLLGIAYRAILIICGANVWIVSLCPLAHMDAFALGSILAVKVKENKLSNKVSVLGIIGLIGIVSVVLVMANRYQTSLLDAYELLSTSKNYLNNWFTGNIYLFISLLTTGLLGLLYFYDMREDYDISGVRKCMTVLGNNSYILYLFHWPVLFAAKRFISNVFVLVVFVFATTFMSAVIFGKVYESMKVKISGGN